MYGVLTPFCFEELSTNCRISLKLKIWGCLSWRQKCSVGVSNVLILSIIDDYFISKKQKIN